MVGSDQELGDSLIPQAIKTGLSTRHLGREIVYRERVGSTNEVAKQLAGQGAPEGTLVIAEEQTAGRGRRGRRWVSPPGSSLLFSLVLRPKLSPAQASRLTMWAAVAVARAVEASTGLTCQLKWPNDVLVSDKKLAGILTETALIAGKLEFAVVGIGLNVNLQVTRFPEIASTATSLSLEVGRAVSRRELLWALLAELERWYEELGEGEGLLAEWQSRLTTLGRWVKVEDGTGLWEGYAQGVDEQGALLLRQADGTLKRLGLGDVTVISSS